MRSFRLQVKFVSQIIIIFTGEGPTAWVTQTTKNIDSNFQ